MHILHWTLTREDDEVPIIVYYDWVPRRRGNDDADGRQCERDTPAHAELCRVTTLDGRSIDVSDDEAVQIEAEAAEQHQ